MANIIRLFFLDLREGRWEGMLIGVVEKRIKLCGLMFLIMKLFKLRKRGLFVELLVSHENMAFSFIG